MAGGPIYSSYSRRVGAVFIFNLMVGTGILTTPHYVAGGGLWLGLGFLVGLCFLSYISVTWVVEGMSLINLQTRRRKVSDSSSVNNQNTGFLVNERTSAEMSNGDAYEIKTKFELAALVEKFIGEGATVLYAIIMICYLYGDLAIYAVAVPKSLRDITCNVPSCTWKGKICSPTTTNFIEIQLQCANETTQAACKAFRWDRSQSWPCWKSSDSTEMYRIYCAIFSVMFGPWVFFWMQKTKYLQMMTTLMRYIVFSIMVIVATAEIFTGHNTFAPLQHIDTSYIQSIFGTMVYGFMCHHSIPGMVTPIDDKKNIHWLILRVYLVVFLVYLLLISTAIFRFKVSDMEDVYTLNFLKAGTVPKGVGIFLNFYPIVAATNFPIISVTLRENLKKLIIPHACPGLVTDSSVGKVIGGLLFPLITVIPPLVLSFFTENVGSITKVTGGIAGVFIQWVFPAWIILNARRIVDTESLMGGYDYDSVSAKNPHRSPFFSSCWIYAILVWSAGCLGFEIYTLAKPS